MSLGLVGRKRGMTRIFTPAGESIPVTVIEALPNRVTQVKTSETDGYRAIQVTWGTRRASRVTKAQQGHFAKAGTPPGEASMEFRLGVAEGEGLQSGSELKVDLGDPSRPRFHWPASDAGPCVPGQAYVGPHGRRPRHH